MADFKSLNGYLVKDEVARDLASSNANNISIMQGEVNNLKDTTANNSSSISTMQNNISTINDNITDVNRDLDTALSYMNSVQAGVEDMTRTYNGVTGDITNLKNDNTTNKNKIGTLETDNVTIKNDILDLQNDKASAQEVANLKGVVLYNVAEGTHEGGTLSEVHTNFDELRIVIGTATGDHGRVEVLPCVFNKICLQHTAASTKSIWLSTSLLTIDGLTFTLSNHNELQLDGSSHSAGGDNTLRVFKIVGIKY